jgi:hypothetical protein
MAKLLGVSAFIDEKCKDGSRGHFLTTEEDLLYIDEEVFTYENKAFGEKYNEQYREGHTSPDLPKGEEGLADRKAAERRGNTIMKGLSDSLSDRWEKNE